MKHLINYDKFQINESNSSKFWDGCSELVRLAADIESNLYSLLVGLINDMEKTSKQLDFSTLHKNFDEVEELIGKTVNPKVVKAIYKCINFNIQKRLTGLPIKSFLKKIDEEDLINSKEISARFSISKEIATELLELQAFLDSVDEKYHSVILANDR